jgi:hypothetical protein
MLGVGKFHTYEIHIVTELIIGDEVMKDDFGYFGSGLEGYVHYMEAFNQTLQDTTPENVDFDDSLNTDSDDDCDDDYTGINAEGEDDN